VVAITEEDLPSSRRPRSSAASVLGVTPGWLPAARSPSRGRPAASKLLHVLLPETVVMWDNNIEPFARDFRDFLTACGQRDAG
jgi:hypothetical protein